MHLVDRVLGKTPGRRRSSAWRDTRQDFLDLFPLCEACGGTSDLEVHHIVPFHVDPSLELEPTNLMTLCSRKKYGLHCHLFVGHRGNYRLVNPNARDTAKRFKLYLRDRALYPLISPA